MDHRKIEGLMVYYKHWGMDEIKKSRKITGFIATMEKIKSLFIDDDIEFAQDFNFLREVMLMDNWVHYGPASAIDFINKIVDVLLADYGGSCKLYKHLHYTNYWKLAQSIGVPVHRIYCLQMTDEQMRNVDAIVSL